MILHSRRILSINILVILQCDIILYEGSWNFLMPLIPSYSTLLQQPASYQLYFLPAQLFLILTVSPALYVSVIND